MGSRLGGIVHNGREGTEARHLYLGWQGCGIAGPMVCIAGPMVCTEETAREMNAGVWFAVSSYKVQDPSPENEVTTFWMDLHSWLTPSHASLEVCL